MMTFNGVRSSCDMVERNSDLRLLASRRSLTRRTLFSAIVACCSMPRNSWRERSEKRPVSRCRPTRRMPLTSLPRMSVGREQRVCLPLPHGACRDRVGVAGILDLEVVLAQHQIDQGQDAAAELEAAQTGERLGVAAGAADQPRDAALRLVQQDQAPVAVEGGADGGRDPVECVVGIQLAVDLFGDRHQALADRRLILAHGRLAEDREAVQLEMPRPEDRDDSGGADREQQIDGYQAGRRRGVQRHAVGEDRGRHQNRLPAQPPGHQERGAGHQAQAAHGRQLGRCPHRQAVPVHEQGQRHPRGDVCRQQPSTLLQRLAQQEERQADEDLDGVEQQPNGQALGVEVVLERPGAADQTDEHSERQRGALGMELLRFLAIAVHEGPGATHSGHD